MHRTTAAPAYKGTTTTTTVTLHCMYYCIPRESTSEENWGGKAERGPLQQGKQCSASKRASDASIRPCILAVRIPRFTLLPKHCSHALATCYKYSAGVDSVDVVDAAVISPWMDAMLAAMATEEEDDFRSRYHISGPRAGIVRNGGRAYSARKDYSSSSSLFELVRRKITYRVGYFRSLRV